MVRYDHVNVYLFPFSFFFFFSCQTCQKSSFERDEFRASGLDVGTYIHTYVRTYVCTCVGARAWYIVPSSTRLSVSVSLFPMVYTSEARSSISSNDDDDDDDDALPFLRGPIYYIRVLYVTSDAGYADQRSFN